MSLTAPEERWPFAVAGDGDEVEGRVDLDGACQVGEKDRGALQHAHHHQLFAVQVAGDCGAHLRHSLSDLLAGIENLKALVSDGGHGDSIA